VAEAQAERRHRWLAPIAAAVALALVVGSALAVAPAIVPTPSPTDRLTSPTVAVSVEAWPATPEPLLAVDWATYSPPAPTPTPTPTPAAILPTCASRAASTEVQQYALSRVGRAEYNCLWAIAQYESHWNPLVINAKSGACGIPQAVPCSKMVPGIPATSGAIDAATIAVYRAALEKVSPNEQIDWMIRYVQGRGEYYRPFGKAHAFAVAANIELGGCEGTGAARTCYPGRSWY
jgi:hypothetical protein